jgi:hypothetical protein
MIMATHLKLVTFLLSYSIFQIHLRQLSLQRMVLLSLSMYKSFIFPEIQGIVWHCSIRVFRYSKPFSEHAANS